MIEFRTRPMPSGAPSGYGTVTRKGYRRIGVAGKQRMEHVLVWEHHNGPVPMGMQVHHKNENKLDNRLENLALVDTLTHKRIHSGCELRDGVWLKPCCNCSVVRPVSEYYERRDGISPWCKPCCIKNATMNKRLRKKRRRLGTSDPVTRLLAWNERVRAFKAQGVAVAVASEVAA